MKLEYIVHMSESSVATSVLLRIAVDADAIIAAIPAPHISGASYESLLNSEAQHKNIKA